MRTSSNWSLIACLALSACSAAGPARPAATATPVAVSPSPTAPATVPSATPPPPQAAFEPALPEARQEVAGVAGPPGKPQLIVIGGFDPARASSRSVFLYAGSQDGWVRLADLPIALDHAAAAALGSDVYLAGGYSNGPAQAGLYVLTPAPTPGANPYFRAVAPMHHARGALALVAAGDRIYAMGGAAGSEVAAVEEYDPANNAWTDVASLPQPRDHVAGFAWQGRACVAGGRFPTSARVDCFDPANRTWSRLPDLPAPTSGAGAAVLGDEVVIAGGEDAGEGKLVALVQRLRGGAWTTEPMLSPRHGIQLAAWGGRALACGGADQPGYHAVSTCTAIGP